MVTGSTAKRTDITKGRNVDAAIVAKVERIDLEHINHIELDHELGYSKYDYKNKATDNSRNGYSSKTIKSNYGKLGLQVPAIGTASLSRLL